jgi:hypothetical protein
MSSIGPAPVEAPFQVLAEPPIAVKRKRRLWRALRPPFPLAWRVFLRDQPSKTGLFYFADQLPHGFPREPRAERPRDGAN